MNNAKPNRILSPAGSVALLTIGYLIFRYALFDLHHMKQWPLVLFVLGLIIIGVSALFACPRIMLSAAVGYHIGYIAGLLFNREWVDAHGTAMNNTWIWCTLVMLAFVCIGAAWELIGKAKKARKSVKTENTHG